MGCCSAKPLDDGSYDPSCCIQVCLPKATGCDNFRSSELPDRSSNKGRVLVIGSSESKLKLRNGKVMNTGHNVTETLVPILHLDAAGYEMDFATPSGKALALEDWSWLGPQKSGYEPLLRDLYARLEGSMNLPMSTADALQKLRKDGYAAVFFPGGHGTMIEMHNPPDNGATSSILGYLHENQIPTVTICHGPNVLRCAPNDQYRGYEITAFPDSGDKQSPSVGYMPGHMVEYLGEELAKQGVTVVNTKADKSCHVHKELISGASPAAAFELGKLVVQELAKK
eukprot:GFYU01007675.1.p1 GENE.GFYU01007675.1~~GFYU01007675.1.p1  ORF type:complete len:283 (+),score=72.19 GFYU01007675.1:101-949(+)